MAQASAVHGSLLQLPSMTSAGASQQSSGRAGSEVGAGVSGYGGPGQQALRVKAHGSWRATGARRGRVRSPLVTAAIREEKKEEVSEADDLKAAADSVEETTRKLGLEAGLWQIFTSKKSDGTKSSKTSQAKDLLTRYGGAYLATSITLSLISFGLCYTLISNGVDVTALLEKVGVQTSETGEKVGTFALAYAAHKAASPIRFPPTVALTPVVAAWFGKKPADIVEKEEE